MFHRLRKISRFIFNENQTFFSAFLNYSVSSSRDFSFLISNFKKNISESDLPPERPVPAIRLNSNYLLAFLFQKNFFLFANELFQEKNIRKKYLEINKIKAKDK